MTHTLIQEYQKKFLKKKIPQLRAGMHVQVTQTIKDGGKERQQLFKGMIIKMHEKKSLNATFTVRKMVDGIAVEKIFPIHAPSIEIEVIRGSKTSRSKLYYLRDRTGKSTRLREKPLTYPELELNTEIAADMMESTPTTKEEAPATEVATEEVTTEATSTTEETPTSEEKKAD